MASLKNLIEAEQPVSGKNLYQRISAVMQDVVYLKKDKAVSTGGSGSYQALSEETVTKNVRDSMIRHGLVILPVEQEQRLEDLNRGAGKIVSLTTVNARYKIINIDNPGEYEMLASSGTGVDSQDKGVGKAQTYAYKYLLLRTFGIATGNETDSVGNYELEQQQEREAAKAIDRATAAMNAAGTKEEVTAAYHKDYLSNPAYKAAKDAAVIRVTPATAI